MNKSYVIQWKSTVNGRAGRGTKMFEKNEAERLVAELNREYPQILHELVEIEPVTTASGDAHSGASSSAPSDPVSFPMLSLA